MSAKYGIAPGALVGDDPDLRTAVVDELIGVFREQLKQERRDALKARVARWGRMRR